MNPANHLELLSNSYAAQSYQRQRQLTLGDLLLENRIVFLQGEIHTGNANELVMKLASPEKLTTKIRLGELPSRE